MTIIKIVGLPMAQPRIKATLRGSHAGVYTPGTADAWKARVAHEAKLACRDRLEGPVRLDVEFVFPRLKGHFTGKGALSRSAPLGWRDSKPDRDNLDKGLLDALRGIAFDDDARVCCGEITKRWADIGEESGALVVVQPAGPVRRLAETIRGE